MMTDDPIVAEVRATRKKIEAIAGADFVTLYKQMLVLQKQYAYRLVTSPLPVFVRELPAQNLSAQG